MGRKTEGYRLRRRGGNWSVRWRIDGTRTELSTGETDRRAAETTARALYAEALKGRRVVQRRRSDRSGAHRITDTEVSEWLSETPVRSSTRGLYEKYAGYWTTELLVLSDAAIASYIRRRLKEASGKSVRSELSALRGYVAWLTESGALARPVVVPALPAAALGTPQSGHRVAAPHYTVEEIAAVLAALPERSGRAGFLVGPRCRLLYETGLRPSTVDALSVPEHWGKGATRLRITADVDKEGFAREVPVSAKAARILRAVAPKSGVIFGVHRYDPFVRSAANKVLPQAKARLFTSQHLRSARITHWLEAGMRLPAAQYLAGHKHASTTDRYVKPGAAVAEEALRRLG